VARRTLREYVPVDGPFPSPHLLTRKAAARARPAELLKHAVAERVRRSDIRHNFVIQSVPHHRPPAPSWRQRHQLAFDAGTGNASKD